MFQILSDIFNFCSIALWIWFLTRFLVGIHDPPRLKSEYFTRSQLKRLEELFIAYTKAVSQYNYIFYVAQNGQPVPLHSQRDYIKSPLDYARDEMESAYICLWNFLENGNEWRSNQ